LFLDQEVYQGVDTNHEEVFIPERCIGQLVRFDFRLWSGLTGYRPKSEVMHRIQMASISWLDEAADDLYYTAQALLETVKLLRDNEPERHDLLHMLDRA